MTTGRLPPSARSISARSARDRRQEFGAMRSTSAPSCADAREEGCGASAAEPWILVAAAQLGVGAGYRTTPPRPGARASARARRGQSAHRVPRGLALGATELQAAPDARRGCCGARERPRPSRPWTAANGAPTGAKPRRLSASVKSICNAAKRARPAICSSARSSLRPTIALP